MRALPLTSAIVAAGAATVAIWFAVDEWSRRETLALGARLYAERCAACHGRTLEGQANWKVRLPSGRLPAPPHDADGHTWHHSDAELFRITKGGMAAVVSDYESDMPAFAGVLADAEIEAVIAFIKSTWPERERAYQAARSRARQGAGS
ncbi:MAG: cytochrome c [Bauldia sp.]|nr:MAG: cytochrome c [Bauldia sp.]